MLHLEDIIYYTKSLNNIDQEVKSSIKATEFVNNFKDKIISHLDSKPKQDFRSFLNNFENLMLQHKKKMMKKFQSDLIEQNYQYLLVWILYVLHDEHAFECQVLYAIKHLKWETFDQIKNSIVINRTFTDLEEVQKQPAKIDQSNYAECIKIAVQKVVEKLSKPLRPQTSKALIKDIENQINNMRDSSKTTAYNKKILESNKDLATKILNILEELDLIYISKNSKDKSIEYYSNLAERYEESVNNGNLDQIIAEDYETNH